MSSLPWSSEIPSHWQVVPARAMAQAVKREPGPDDMTVTAFRDGQVTLRSNRRTDGFTESVKDIGYQGVRNGEVVIHSMDAFAGAIGVSDSNGKMSPVVHIYTTPDDNPEFVVHSLRVASKAGFIRALAKGIRERSTSFDRSVFKSMLLPRPPRVEQDEIVEFLGRETERIDDLIAEQRGLIETLRERRVSVITRAVTVGVREHDQMKSTDEPTLGWIPEGWEVRRIKTVGRAIIGLTYSPEDIVDSGEGRLVLRAGNIQDGKLSFDDNVYVARELPNDLQLQLGDIVICARNGSAKLIGKNAVASEEVVGETWGAFMVVLRTDINHYLRWVLNSEIFRAQAGLFSTSTINQLTSRTLHNLKFALPPIEEQHEIFTYLDDQTSRIDALIAESEDLIALSLERRAALITAAVTGQIDVRAAA